MATEFTLKRPDGEAFGSFDHTQTIIRQYFPTAKFEWTASGPEKLRMAKERGIKFPEPLRQALETLPSLLEGIAEGAGFHITFGLGHEEPVRCLYITPRGNSKDLENGLGALTKEVGSQLKVSGID